MAVTGWAICPARAAPPPVLAERAAGARNRSGAKGVSGLAGRLFTLPEQTSPFTHRSKLAAAGAAVGIDALSGVVDRGADGFAKLRCS